MMWCSSYDLIFRTTIDHTIPVAADGTRTDSAQYRLELQQQSDLILQQIANVETLPLGIESRVTYALARIEACLSSNGQPIS
jgi:hypothetical protein